MADTLIVLASPTGYEPPGYGGGYFPPSLSGRHPAASGTGPRAIQGAISFLTLPQCVQILCLGLLIM